MQTVLLAAGGTAGHVEPALATADALAAAGFRPVVLGTAAGLEARLVPARGYDLATVPRVPLPRRPGRDLATVPHRLRVAFVAALAVVDREKPCAVVGFGGYVSVPAYLAARRRRVPIVVHEANARAGIANRLGARLTPFVAVANVDCGLPHTRLVGIPLRSEIADLDRAGRRSAARAAFGLTDGPVLLVTGGSQGAGSINRAVTAAAAVLDRAGVSVLHHAGAAQAEHVAAAVAAFPRHHVLPYIEQMADAYAAADLALCRAGAMTCAELAAVGLPAAYVPLPIGNGEQRLNAEPIVAAGGGLLVADADLDVAWLERTLLPLLTDPTRLARMGTAARAGTAGDAAGALVDLVRAAAAARQTRMST